MAQYEWGFDLTDFKNADDFKALLKRHGLSSYKKVPKMLDGAPSYNQFTWRGKGLLLVTGNNPITGEFSGQGRKPEKGYASYIGIEGDEQKVRALAADIRKTATNIKDEEEGVRGFI